MTSKATGFRWEIIIFIFIFEQYHGVFLQAIVKIYHAKNGWADVTLMYQDGEVIFDERVEGQFWYSDAVYNYPKWGLYRTVDTIFNPMDSIDFQNVQIWLQQ